jgi:hypothetical protein
MQWTEPAGKLLFVREPIGAGSATDQHYVMSQKDELSTSLEAVHDEESFLQFLLALRDDREASTEQEKAPRRSPYGPDALGWENTTIERFFDTAVRWARDSVNGNPYYKRPDNPWRRCADILFAAKGYE